MNGLGSTREVVVERPEAEATVVRTSVDENQCNPEPRTVRPMSERNCGRGSLPTSRRSWFPPIDVPFSTSKL